MYSWSIKAFLPQRSTVGQLLSVVDDWDGALDSGSAVHVCFIDIAKAFDRVDHVRPPEPRAINSWCEWH